MRFPQLEGRRVALWGWGREGRATHAALRVALPAGTPLALFCTPVEVDDARALGDDALTIAADPDADALAAFDVVVKSPGISAYRPELLDAQARGTRFIGATALWFSTRAAPGAIAPGTCCITGTKGKSTTTALVAHLLRAGGHRTALAGNIGLPLLELGDARAEAFAIELSSYQTRDIAASGVRPAVAVVSNIFPEHLDWHGGEARYVADKLSLVTEAAPGIAVLDAADPTLAALALPRSEVRWFNREDGWHLRGEAIHRGGAFVLDGATLPLPGRHNRVNLCAALAAIEALGFDAVALAPHAATFAPLPHRLQPLGVRDGIAWVNDSISTTPHASLAALAMHEGRRVALLVGGHDRGLDWSGFADAMRTRAPLAIVTMGQNGDRIHALLAPVAAAGGWLLSRADDLAGAVAQARDALAGDGVLLLSPGAPSFGPFKDYTARGRAFAALGGFDPAAITAIGGLGIAP